MKRAAAITVSVLFSALVSAQATSAEAADCARLAETLRLPHTTVTAAEEVAAGRFEPPAGSADAFKTLPAFCRVALTIRPSSDSDIRSEVWLPLSGWNGKFLMVGNGAWGGSIQYGALANGLGRGYAVASTDTGHTGSDASFAMGHPEKLADFAHRSVHETAVQAKATVAALFGTAPRLSYFEGCSGGGRQAFMEAQRYPDDFDAIIAGAPGYNRTSSFFQMVMLAQATLNDPASFIPATKYPAIHRAALDACDANDGATDGLISDPLRCSFDPAALTCKGADEPRCLTGAQAAAARRIYAPVVHPGTGEEIFPGLEPGSELRWGATSGGPRPLQVADDLFKFVIFQDPQWDFRTLDIETHLPLARKIDGGMLSPTSPDIHRFVARGGKLLMYHGWADQNISPRSTVNYFGKLEETLGPATIDNSVALYMVPGMGHCGGGEGPAAFDMLGALEAWRERGQAPAEILATQRVGDRIGRTRPLCRYPLVPRYKGTGSLDRAESFACRQP
jgi:feruloyl esterase